MDLDFLTPDKKDHYLAQIAAEVHRAYRKNPGDVKINEFFLKFKPAAPEERSEQTLEESKAAWRIVLGDTTPLGVGGRKE